MVPSRENPPDDWHGFSPAVQDALEKALREPWTGTPSDELRRALKAAAREARDRHLRAEEMLIGFKELERRVFLQRTPAALPSAADRSAIIRALIDAYYLD